MSKSRRGEISLSLAELRRLKPGLDEVDTRLKKQIERAEEALSALKVGVRFSKKLSEERISGYAEFLAFDRYGGKWRLLHEAGPDGGEEHEWTTRPLADCNRDLRGEAMAMLPELLEEAVEAISRRIAERQALVEELDDALDEIVGASTAKEGK
jgi:hypothetical protein